MTEQLDDDRGAREPAVDADEVVVGPGQHGLALRTRQSRRRDQPEELALQPAVPATRDLAAVEHVEEGRDAVATLGAQCGDAAMQEVLRGEPVAERAVERGGERLGWRFAREVDERPGRAGDRDVLDRLLVELRELCRRVDDDVESPNVALAGQGQVERDAQPDPVEPVEGGGGRAGCPARLADVEQERPQIRERPDRRADEPEGVGTNLDEEAALDSATKLVVGHPVLVRLSTGERPQLTRGDRRDATEVDGHGDQPTR
jgi:hypothetical protein